MKSKIYSFCFSLTLFFTSIAALAQPAFLGSRVADGNYTEYPLNDLGAFRQTQIQATNSAAAGPGGNREWNFIQSSGDFNNNWRPYTSNQTRNAPSDRLQMHFQASHT